MTPEGGGRGPVAQASRLWNPPPPLSAPTPTPERGWGGCGEGGEVPDQKFIGNAKSFFRYDTCSKNLNPPLTPLFQRGELSEIPLKVPL